MKEGIYLAIAKEDLTLLDSREHWKKGESYAVKVEQGGILHLQGELDTSHYTKEGVEKLSYLFEFEELN